MEALDIMDLHQMFALPVVDEEGMLVGVLREIDLRIRLLGGNLDDGLTEKTVVGQYMQRDPLCLTEEASLEEARLMMLEQECYRLPVVDREGRLIGMITLVEVCQALLGAYHPC